MQSSLINIDNLKGIIIPEEFLKQCNIENKINMEVVANTIIISAIEPDKRRGWAEAFKEMALNGDDELVIPDVFEDEDFGC
ncbi:MAG: AbrB/MazE/SpoVT family DNA-binding domain-containing protein [Bacteroidota bacterium]